MSAGPHYTPYHPKWYRRRVSVWWWMESGSYTGFVLRELSAVAVAFFSVLLIAQIRALARGPEAYARFARALNPYGDGRASDRIAAVLREGYGLRCGDADSPIPAWPPGGHASLRPAG